MIQNKLIEAFEANNGILTTELAKNFDINDSTLRKAVDRNDIYKHGRGIYLLDSSYADDLYLLQLKYPKGIYSHGTAVMLHWLSTNYPFTYHVSFPRGYHLNSAQDQNIDPYYVSKNELTDEYVDLVDSWDSNPIRVTNLEKTIVDMLRTKKAAPGVVDEMIDDYLGRKNKNLSRLERYGKKFNVEKVIDERVLNNVK